MDKSFYEFIKSLIIKLKEDLSSDKDLKEKIKAFNTFDQILESILAYYTYYNPKEN